MAPFLCAALEPAAGSNQAHHQQQDDGADHGIDDFPDHAGADVNAELRQQQVCHQRAGDADKDVTDQAESSAAHDLAREPAGDQPDKQERKYPGSICAPENPPVRGAFRRGGFSLPMIPGCDDLNLSAARPSAKLSSAAGVIGP